MQRCLNVYTCYKEDLDNPGFCVHECECQRNIHYERGTVEERRTQAIEYEYGKLEV